MFESVDSVMYLDDMYFDREEMLERFDSNMLVHRYLFFNTNSKNPKLIVFSILPLANRSNSKQACALDCVEEIPANM